MLIILILLSLALGVIGAFAHWTLIDKLVDEKYPEDKNKQTYKIVGFVVYSIIAYVIQYNLLALTK